MAPRSAKDRRLLERIEQLAEQSVGQLDGGVQLAFERADRWLMSLVEIGAGERLMRVEAYTRFFEAAGGPRVVRVVAPPVEPAAVAAAERALGFTLPASYRALLTGVGQLSFMDRQVVGGHEICQATYAADQLAGARRRFARQLEPVQRTYAEQYDQLRDVYRTDDPDWRTWRPGRQGGVFRPEEIEGARLLPICPYYDEEAHLMALHLGDDDDAPVFLGGGGDEPCQFISMGHGLQAWISLMVDRVIEEVTTTLSVILG